MESKMTLTRQLEAKREFERVLFWLKRWGYALVDSDGDPITEKQEETLRKAYAEAGI